MTSLKRMISLKNGWLKTTRRKEIIVPEAVNVKVPTKEGKSTKTPGSALPCRQTLHWSVSRADCHLPKSPHKKSRNHTKVGNKVQTSNQTAAKSWKTSQGAK